MKNPEELVTYGTLDEINVKENRRGNKIDIPENTKGAIK